MRIGKIVIYDKVTGRGSLVDKTYGEKLYNFVVRDVQAGQYVIYETTNLNPITGYRECQVIAPKLWAGIMTITSGDYESNFVNTNPIIWGFKDFKGGKV